MMWHFNCNPLIFMVVRLPWLMILAAIMIFLAGCATPGQQARTEGTSMGALIGAGVGSGLGYAFGGSKGAAIGGGIGALFGGTVGYTYADRITKRHEELERAGNDLNARIQFAQGLNNDTQAYNQQLKAGLDAQDRNINGLNAQVEKHQVSQQQLRKEKQVLDRKVADANTQLAAAEKELQYLKSFSDQQTQSSSEMDAEIARLEGQVAQLKRNTSALASLSQRL
jgi:YMGG-like Gly-zipper